MGKSECHAAVIWIVVLFSVASSAGGAAQSDGCYLDARICPDGSSVGRTGPSCGFAKCPGEDQPYNWIVFRDATQAIEFEYPLRLGTWFITAESWPPAVEFIDSEVPCKRSDSAKRTETRRLGDRLYCATTETTATSTGVATRYRYTTQHDGRTLDIRFTIRFPRCSMVEERFRSECDREKQAFSADGLVQRLAESVRSVERH